MYQKYIKRLLDIIFSAVALIVLSPVMLCTALVVRVKLGSPVLFKQQRPGKNGEIFTLCKFRSMKNTSVNGKLLSDEERLTRFGRILRSTSLDELPELWCILTGKMSIVGPRPLLTEYLPYYTEQERHRHDVLPGLTGLAQVNGRNALTWEEKFNYDLEYVKHITFRGDVAVIFKTIEKVFKRSDILIGKEFKVGKLMVERAEWQLTPEGAVRPSIILSSGK